MWSTADSGSATMTGPATQRSPRDAGARDLRWWVLKIAPGQVRAGGTVNGDRMPREALLARTLVQLADTLVDDFDVVELLTQLADRCVEVLDVAAAGIMLVAPPGELRVM